MAELQYHFQINSMRPREKMKLMAGDTMEHIQHGFDVQKVFPIGEVYPGWFNKNASRIGDKAWKSTGEAAQTMRWQTHFVSGKGDFPSEIHLLYFFRNYIGFVDYGVGKGRPLDKVQHSKEARRNERYIDAWTPKSGKTHRPIFRKELRHLRTRAANWLVFWSGNLFFDSLWYGMEDITHSFSASDANGGFALTNLQRERMTYGG